MTTPLCLLDLDGTLLESGPGITAAVAHAYSMLGLAVPAPEALRSFVGPPITHSFATHGVPADRVHEAVQTYRAQFVTTMISGNALFDGVLVVLDELRAAGVQLVVATSKPEVFARPICEAFGITPRVDAIFGAPVDEVTSSKADVVAAALAAFPDASPVVMVGDREHDVLGARACGVETVGVTWGYAAEGELAAAGAVALVEDVADLGATVLQHLAVRLEPPSAVSA